MESKPYIRAERHNDKALRRYTRRYVDVQKRPRDGQFRSTDGNGGTVYAGEQIGGRGGFGCHLDSPETPPRTLTLGGGRTWL